MDNMLFWKESCTYQFLEPYSDPKKLRKEYNRRKARILGYEEYGERFRIMRAEHPMAVEEQIEKAPVKMLIPLGTLIVPAMLLSILGPLLSTAMAF